MSSFVFEVMPLNC